MASDGAPDRPYEEDRDASGAPRAGYGQLLGALRSVDLGDLIGRVRAHLADHSVTFGGKPFVVDPIPRLITAADWERVADGLAQRARALNAFLADAYAGRRIVEAGIVDAATIDGAEGYEPDLANRVPATGGVAAAIIGFDLVRAPDGEFLVLEDNMRTPSGIAYLTAARAALEATLPDDVPDHRPVAPEIHELLGDALRAAAPARAGPDPRIAIVTDGPRNVAHYEHAALARSIGAELLTPDQLHTDGDRLTARLDPDDAPITLDVVYRRTDEDRVRDEHGELTAIARLLVPAWLGGNLGLVNHFGNGVADDKLVHSHVEDFVRFYLGEEPRVRSVPTTSLHSPEAVADASERLRDLVIKPRHGHGGSGVIVGSQASADELAQARDELREHPDRYICQPIVPLSRHPTVIDGRLAPRHVDLRPFAFSGPEPRLAPGGLSRVAFDEDEMIVNSSRNGGGKDTWVLE